MVKQYAKGGLKIITLNAFINALKSTWIRRLLTSHSKWQEFIKMHVNLEKLTSFNTELIRERCNTLKNQFWTDAFKSFLDINRKTEETEEQILKTPLFYNRNITIDGTHLLYKNLYNKGIRVINDLVKENGTFYNLQEIRESTEIPVNHLHY